MNYQVLHVIENSPEGLTRRRSGIYLGRTYHDEPVALNPDALERHLLVLGKTGTGKSNVILQIVGHILKGNLGSVAIFDPHGTMAKTIAGAFPDRSVVISQKELPGTAENMGITLNAMTTSNGSINSDLAVSWIKDAFATEDSFSRGTWGPRLEVVFTSILSEIMKTREEPTLGDLLELLTDYGKMKRFISTIQDEQLKSFLKTQISDWRGWNQYTSSSINKLLPLLTNTKLRRLISSRKDSVDISALLERGGTALVPEVWRDAVPEDTYRIMTILLILKIWLGRLGKKNSTPLYLVFDEAQLVPSRILDKLLREGRKFGIRVIMATQYLGRELSGLSETLRGNVSNVISFSLFEKDAQTLAHNFFSSEMTERLSSILKNQTIHRAVIWTHGKKGIYGPLSFDPRYREREIDDESFRKVLEESIRNYGSPLEKVKESEVDTDLHEFLINELQKFLEQRSVESDRNIAVEGIYPDLFFTYRARTYHVEVEVSDLVNFRRIWKKVTDYSGKPLVFLTPPGYSKDVFHKILDSLAEIPGGGNSLGDVLGSVSIIEYDKGFHFFASEKLRQLRLDMLQEGSYTRTMAEQRHSEVRNFVYSRMLKEKSFSIQFPAEEVERTFGRGNAQNARSYLCGDSKVIRVTDLFRVKAIDSKS